MIWFNHQLRFKYPLFTLFTNRFHSNRPLEGCSASWVSVGLWKSAAMAWWFAKLWLAIFNIIGCEVYKWWVCKIVDTHVLAVLFSEPLSDFSISAIQSMRGSTLVSPTTSITTTSTTVIAAETQTQTKSIATMTSDQKQDKSISPMEVIMRKETGFQFRRFEETKISTSFSPSKSSLAFDDAFIRKSLHHQIDLTDTSIMTSETSKLATATIKSRSLFLLSTSVFILLIVFPSNWQCPLYL